MYSWSCISSLTRPRLISRAASVSPAQSRCGIEEPVLYTGISLEDLPTEVILRVIESFEDYDSLLGFLRASPLALRTFFGDYAEVRRRWQTADLLERGQRLVRQQTISLERRGPFNVFIRNLCSGPGGDPLILDLQNFFNLYQELAAGITLGDREIMAGRGYLRNLPTRILDWARRKDGTICCNFGIWAAECTLPGRSGMPGERVLAAYVWGFRGTASVCEFCGRPQGNG